MQRSLLIFENSVKSKVTRKNYLYYLQIFIRYYKIKDHDSLVGIEQEKIQLMVEDYVMDLKKRVNPNSVPTYLYGIQAFFESNDIELRWRKIRRLYPAKVKKTGEKPYTDEQVKAILDYASSLRNKAIIHFLASSGVRIGALADLRLKHLQSMPLGCKAITVYEGTTDEYVTFLTPEASEALDMYLERRKNDKEYLSPESPVFRTKYQMGFLQATTLSRRDTINIVERIVNKVVTRIKKSEKRYDIQLYHGFRKRFDTIMELNSGIKESMSEKLMGHSDGVRGRYVRPTVEKLFEEYKKCIGDLTIDSTKKKQAELDKVIKEKSELLRERENSKFLSKRLDKQDEVISDMKRLLFDIRDRKYS